MGQGTQKVLRTSVPGEEEPHLLVWQSPVEAFKEIARKLLKDILFSPPVILDDRIALLGGGTEVYRYHNHLVSNAFL